MATTTERGYHNTSSDRDALRRFAGSGSLIRSARETCFRARLDSLRSQRGQNEAVDVLLNLIEQDGAGQWPPLVVYDDWPSALQLYKDIYHEVVPQLSSSSPLLDDDTLMVRRESFRSQMRELLKELINLLEVERLLNAAEAEFAKRLHYTTHVA
ncbi:hypothetical protein N7489_001514 [Penicillium chrysogenum]|uniref:Uncharacterized protein n=1 Tax=Penicillium chrysogenum TaxID=5076 RepID=A0ABQ8WJ04_PENCH|nr:uncharacterized protein N7489_001514 [Penicillium chrysogenum]KAJ5251104.1 hypothetical protein N7489_001514 [Penicillium chrysogenum]KAJ5262539.1 hypothetical protein N7524_007844 [Penicillium chrysogenum]KAJ5270004.1 hypothetical protein N7505_005762 [Penicillium chrysogenum]KAJ6147261.1 hypothetical protein N7497_009243 [Penicillium chrysogenum]